MTLFNFIKLSQNVLFNALLEAVKLSHRSTYINNVSYYLLCINKTHKMHKINKEINYIIHILAFTNILRQIDLTNLFSYFSERYRNNYCIIINQ